MKRVLVGVVAALILVLLPAPSFQGQPPGRVAQAATRPNILIFLTDDQRGESGMGTMPNVNRLFGQQGTEFTNYSVTTPLCCPSRGSFWSGRYAHNHGVLGNDSYPQPQLSYDQSTAFQTYLRASGYRTALVGKYWNQWPLGLAAPGYDLWAKFGGGYNNVAWGVNGTVSTRSGYTTDVAGQFSVQDLQTFEQNDDQPWLLYVAPQAPHAPMTPAAAYANAPVPAWTGNPAVAETDKSDKPPPVRSSSVSFASANSDRTQQLRTLMSVDDMVQRVFDTMDALDETQDTLAIFTSDNGYLWGEHGWTSKRVPYTQSTQVPFFMRWPGHVAEGATDDRLTANIDVEPTLLEVAGITPTHAIDGVSMFDPGARQRLLLEYFKSPDSPLGPWASTITQTYQYTEWYNTTTGALTFREYYDLVNDPWQLVNLLADGNPSNDPPIAPLSAQLAADRACVGSACPRPVSTSPDTDPPSAPGTPTGTSTRAGQIDLSWAAASDDRATSLSYRVFRDGGSSPVGTVQGPATGTVTFTDPGLPPGSVHTYTVDAFDGTNRGPLSGVSAAITVASGQAVIFADDFTAGFANWSGVTNLTIDNATGGVAPPSARSQLTSVPDYAFKNLTGGPFSSVCMSTRVNVASIGSSTVTVLRLRTAANGNVIRVFANQSGLLYAKSDVSGTQKWSGVAIGSGWHTIELCGTVGASTTWDLSRDGTVIVNDWVANTGTTGVGRVEIGETLARTWNVHFDDVVVDQSPG